MNDLNVDGMAIAPSVLETIISIAAREVTGVASVGSSVTGGLRSLFAGKPSTQGIEISVGDDDKVNVSVHIEVYYGYVLPDLAAQVRSAVVDAVASQVGMPVGNVDIFVDGIQFAE